MSNSLLPALSVSLTPILNLNGEIHGLKVELLLDASEAIKSASLVTFALTSPDSMVQRGELQAHDEQGELPISADPAH
jgi:hypothetical protein